MNKYYESKSNKDKLASPKSTCSDDKTHSNKSIGHKRPLILNNNKNQIFIPGSFLYSSDAGSGKEVH